MIKKLLSGVAVAASLLALAAPASATPTPLTNWKLDSNGSSTAGGLITVAQYLDITGTAFVQNTFTGANTFVFNEAGTFNVFSADQNTPLTPSIRAEFTGSGSGTTGGTLSFNTDGVLKLFSGSTTIGEFHVLTGSGNLLANSTLPNGTISIIFQAISLASGYWFDSSDRDLSTVADVTLGFATTNAIELVGQTASAVNQSLYSGAFGGDPAGGYTDNGTTKLVISNNGQYQLAYLPEPGSVALAGLALIGLGFARRRKA